MKSNLKNKGEKGVVLYLAIIIMGIMMAISLALSVILVNQIKMVRSMGDSVVAFYAADSGMEKTLEYYKNNNNICNIVGFDEELENEAKYIVVDSVTYTDSDGIIYCRFNSSGSFKNTQRRIEVKIKQ